MNTGFVRAVERRRCRQFGLGLALVALTLVIATQHPQQVWAGPSPSISPPRVTFDEPIGQGEHIRLPVLTVGNRGDETGIFRVELNHYGNQEQLVPDSSWFRISPERFTLEPGEQQAVEVELRLPEEAAVGDYQVLLTAAGSPETAATGSVVVTGAVALTLTFSVKNVNFHFYDPVTNFFTDRAPFSYIGTGMLLGLLGIYLFQRTYGLELNVGIRRKE